MRRRFLAAVLFAAVLVNPLQDVPVSAAGSYPAGTTGYNVAVPACGQTLPATFSFGIVGVTGGRSFNHSSCLAAEYGWAKGGSAAPSLYMNLNAPIGSTASNGMTGPRGNCSKKDKACQAYNYGYNAAGDAYTYAVSQHADAAVWWLDVETANSWSANTTLNALTVQGAVKFLQDKGKTAGIYSTQYQWKTITGGYSFTPPLPAWVAGAPDLATAKLFCSPANAAKYSFGGGAVWLAQYPDGGFDGDYAC
jgi:hypothetical protein